MQLRGDSKKVGKVAVGLYSNAMGLFLTFTGQSMSYFQSCRAQNMNFGRGLFAVPPFWLIANWASECQIVLLARGNMIRPIFWDGQDSQDANE